MMLPGIDPRMTIVLFNGGFAGDLVCALHNPCVFQGFWEGRCMLDRRLWRLKDSQWHLTATHQQKLQYVASIQHLGVCASHDLAFSLRHREHTVLITCSDLAWARQLFDRWDRSRYPDADMVFDDWVAWQDLSRSIFTRQLDVSDVRLPNFLDLYDLRSPQAEHIVARWLSLRA